MGVPQAQKLELQLTNSVLVSLQEHWVIRAYTAR
jgi:hypothetical protein